MAMFKVKGVRRDNGESVSAKVEAADAESARARAGRHGIDVRSVEPLEVLPAPAPVAVEAERAAPLMIDMPPPMPRAAEPWRQFVADGQDPATVARLFESVRQILTSNEQLLYIGVQKKPVMNVKPDAAALTTRRVIVYFAKLIGTSFEDFQWIDLVDARLTEGMLGATLTFRHVNGREVSIDYLPKQQARALYRIAQEQEEAARANRRAHHLEETRAAAGAPQVAIMATNPGVSMMPPPAPPAAPAPAAAPDLASRMQTLKQLLDAGLISQAEFDAKRAEILRAI